MAKTQPGIHENFSRDEPAAGASDRSFGLVIGVALALIGLWPVAHGRPPRLWVVGIAAAFVIAALANARVLSPPQSRLDQARAPTPPGGESYRDGAIFFGVLTPIGLLLRLAGKDLLRLRREPDAQSYSLERRPPGPGSYAGMSR